VQENGLGLGGWANVGHYVLQLQKDILVEIFGFMRIVGRLFDSR
jgi:hypothetical protein